MTCHPTRLRPLVAALLLVVASPALLAAPPPDPTGDSALLSAGFLEGHPDLRYRMLGMDAFKAGKHEQAVRFFKRAARYGDKPSQGMLAEMLWSGNGLPRDPAQAYAWMDLAAERDYAGFAAWRELYWSQLDEQQRQRALDVGEALYAEYGDDVALPRLAIILRREKKQVTGSRTGFTGSVRIEVPGPDSTISIDGSKFYDERYWNPAQYLAWHDSLWKDPPAGRVSVGEVEQVPAAGIRPLLPPAGGDQPPAEAPRQDPPPP
ncbi:tetratricopeptide repeat protein [Pseudoxanthomonas sp. 10H]|uniref:tetratricopeptide repeat protein n=1 Tax=Pseudoxanthomonas sp. 10H TaxID=3242729 RepID=UPI003558C034